MLTRKVGGRRFQFKCFTVYFFKEEKREKDLLIFCKSFIKVWLTNTKLCISTVNNLLCLTNVYSIKPAL